jgi:glutamate-1-semialdehyde aminotransferase
MALDPTSATAKWVSRMQAAGPQITEGVNAVTTAPGVAAAKQSAKWMAKLQASQQKWQKNVAAVSLSDWQTAMTSRGIPAISTGVTAKQGNYQAFAAKFFPYLAAGKASIDAMDTSTLAASTAKAVAQIQYNAKYTGGNGRSA